ncbi:cystatin-type cysteine proteinase inhibitor CPI-1 [Loa loa]|uniref:Cystatin-type cysteine proteinase inhibitor CPI-1 n=1 Tax=Loa loa TaxID=7209 RepID=A0A1S0UBV0_LOALO|nr:cystatin-type cysteine proteinase inhibitor CPI-1 [Loa loa]EFO27413.1 cystatin-type cysteine proteinase inhibitor CPI-1 [Loa loa]
MFYLIVWLSVSVIISKSSEGIKLGGATNADTNDPEIKEVAEKAMVQVNGKTRSRNLYKLVKIINARTQVVSGTKYYFTILAASTNCRKAGLQIWKPSKPLALQNTGEINLAKCAVDTNKPTKQFNVEVWSQPWTNTFQVTLT